MPNISRLHWCEMPSDDRWEQFALWPEPVDHDECFATAGFTAFADSDATWDAEFETLLSSLIESLGSHGSPHLVRGETPEGATPSVVTSLLCAATDDQFQPCIVSFGSPAQAQLKASDGHPVLWLRLMPGLAFQPLLQAVAAGRPTKRTVLDWSALSPAA